MEFVEGPIHTDGDLKEIQISILSDLVHHCGHSCPTQLSGTLSDHSAHLLHNDAVVTCALQPKVLEDVPDLKQCQAITGDTRWGTQA